MAQFLVEENVPTWITYSATVQADTAEEAIEAFKAGGSSKSAEETYFGELIEGSEVTIAAIEKAK